MTHPNKQEADTTAAEQAGFHAAQTGVAASQCPYAFSRVGVEQDVFEALYHPLLDAWMVGWNRWYIKNNRKPWVINQEAVAQGGMNG